MTTYRLKIENVNYNLNSIRLYFMDNYPNTIHMFLYNGWFKIYNKDAEILSTIFNYKLFDDNYSPYLGNICCGFPLRILDKVKNKLAALHINFTIIDTSDYSYEFYDYENYNSYTYYYKVVDNIIEEEKQRELIKQLKEKKEELDEEEPLKANEGNLIIKTPKTKVNYSLYVEIGDTITVRNLKTNEKEKYTIIPTYHDYKPISFYAARGNKFGEYIYKDELLTHSDLEKGQILSESDLAKKLLGSYMYSKVLLIDENFEECMYEIEDIKKGE